MTTQHSETKILVVDSSAIINGLPTSLLGCDCITTPQISRELGDRMKKLEHVKEYEPRTEFLSKVKEKVTEAMDNLSKNDMGLLALALEFNAPVATDDYGIQNIAKKLGVEYVKVAEPGIKKVLDWQYYCPGCKRKYKAKGSCEVCGTNLKRKVTQSSKPAAKTISSFRNFYNSASTHRHCTL